MLWTPRPMVLSRRLASRHFKGGCNWLPVEASAVPQHETGAECRELKSEADPERERGGQEEGDYSDYCTSSTPLPMPCRTANAPSSRPLVATHVLRQQATPP